MIIGKGLSIKNYELTFQNLPSFMNGKRLIFITDLHGCQYGKENAELISLIDEAKPDFLLVGGDMVVGGLDRYGRAKKESKPSVETALGLLKILSKKYMIYHALGNHEEKLEKKLFIEYNKGLEKLGIPLLDNKSIVLSFNQEKISFYGLSLEKKYYPKGKRLRMREEEVDIRLGKKKNFSILLAHSPFYFSAYQTWGAELTLSGHLHGGIMRLPYLGGVLGPDLLPFPKFSGGLYEEKEKKMLVSCGLGTHTIPLRIFNPPELSVIDLKGGEKKYGN